MLPIYCAMWCWFGFRIFWTQPTRHRAAFMPLTCFNVTTRGFTQHSIALIISAFTFWRCLYRVSYHIITAFTAYSPLPTKTATYIPSPARWRKRTKHDMAFCRVLSNRRLRYFLLYLCHQSYPKVPKPHQNIGFPILNRKFQGRHGEAVLWPHMPSL